MVEPSYKMKTSFISIETSLLGGVLITSKLRIRAMRVPPLKENAKKTRTELKIALGKSFQGVPWKVTAEDNNWRKQFWGRYEIEAGRRNCLITRGTHIH